MARFVFRRGTAAEAQAKNIIPLAGEGIFETDTGLFKIGDGETRYNDLPYYVTTESIQELVDEAVNNSPGAAVDLYNHIMSSTPHPAYDDGPSWILLYENAKV